MEAARLLPGIRRALEKQEPVVALESALITHGFSHPANLQISRRIEAAVEEVGANPATVAVIDGTPRVGLTESELLRLAAPRRAAASSTETPQKLSLRDLPIAVARGVTGGTTVAATLQVAHSAGIQVMATGGIGGVHRGNEWDISADLTALGTIPVTVVCSGAKAILDLPRTREVLETRGVPVIGYGTTSFPAFFSRDSALGVDLSLETPEDVADLVRARATLGLKTALLVCVPVPRHAALAAAHVEEVIARALGEARSAGIAGKEVTPFLLARIVELTGGKSRLANEALLENNARVAGRVARALARSKGHV